MKDRDTHRDTKSLDDGCAITCIPGEGLKRDPSKQPAVDKTMLFWETLFIVVALFFVTIIIQEIWSRPDDRSRRAIRKCFQISKRTDAKNHQQPTPEYIQWLGNNFCQFFLFVSTGACHRLLCLHTVAHGGVLSKSSRSNSERNAVNNLNETSTSIIVITLLEW